MCKRIYPRSSMNAETGSWPTAYYIQAEDTTLRNNQTNSSRHVFPLTEPTTSQQRSVPNLKLFRNPSIIHHGLCPRTICCTLVGFAWEAEMWVITGSTGSVGFYKALYVHGRPYRPSWPSKGATNNVLYTSKGTEGENSKAPFKIHIPKATLQAEVFTSSENRLIRVLFTAW